MKDLNKKYSFIGCLKIYKAKIKKMIYNDEKYIKASYKKKFKKDLNLKNPTSFNEKIQWLKLYDRNPFYSKLVDKYEVRKYVESKLGEEYLTKLYGVYDTTKEIDIASLPEKFVLKTAHDSGGVIICRDKSKLNWENVKSEFDFRLKQNYYLLSREYHYNKVKPRIVCEELLVEKGKEDLYDYKIFCFNGVPKLIQVDINRFTDHKRNFYDVEWKLKEFNLEYDNFDGDVKKPGKLLEMLMCAEKLSEGIKFCRVDLYCLEERIIFGEITFFPEAGFGKFSSDEADRVLGELIEL